MNLNPGSSNENEEAITEKPSNEEINMISCSGNSRKKWTPEAEHILLQYLEIRKVGQRNDKTFWENVSVCLQSEGHDYSPDQCRNKWKNHKVKFPIFSFFLKHTL